MNSFFEIMNCIKVNREKRYFKKLKINICALKHKLLRILMSFKLIDSKFMLRDKTLENIVLYDIHTQSCRPKPCLKCHYKRCC